MKAKGKDEVIFRIPEAIKKETEKAVWDCIGIQDPNTATDLEQKKFLLILECITYSALVTLRADWFLRKVITLDNISDDEYIALEKMIIKNQ